MRRLPFAFGLSGAMPRWRGNPLALVRRARPYVHAIPQILAYQVVTKLALLVVLAGLKELASWALASQGRVAVTSGDWRFLFTSWQGWVLVLAGLAVLYAYIAFDLNVKVAYSGHVVRGEQVSLRRTVAEGVAAIRKFLCPSGLVVVLYIAPLAPVVGVGLAIG